MQSEDPRWLQALASRNDVSVERLQGADAAGAKLVVIDQRAAALPDLARVGAIHHAHPDVPIILAVGPGGESLREGAFAAGAADVLFFPADESRLEETVGWFAGIGARRWPRHRVRLPVTVRAGASRLQATAENLSRGGVQLRSKTPLTPGQVVALEVPFSKKGPTELWGLVRGSASGGSVGHMARLRFVALKPVERETLERYLDSLDAGTRSTEPVEALLALKRIEPATIRQAIAAPGSAPDWLSAALAALGEDERRALASEEAAGRPWFTVALARVRAIALAEALEKYDPRLDDEAPAEAADLVLSILEGVPGARLAAAELPETSRPAIFRALDEIDARLLRAVAARFPHLAAMSDLESGRSEALRRLDHAGAVPPSVRTRNRLLAALAGLVIGLALVYTVVALIERFT